MEVMDKICDICELLKLENSKIVNIELKDDFV